MRFVLAKAKWTTYLKFLGEEIELDWFVDSFLYFLAY